MTIPPMPNCTADQMNFGRLGRRSIEANFKGGDLSSDGGVMLLRQLVTHLRQAWPDTRFIVRGDSGVCRQPLIRWCEREDVGYLIGVAKNKRLLEQVAEDEERLRQAFQRSQVKQRTVGEFRYAADSWKCERRVLSHLEYGPRGANPRFVVTNLTDDATTLYDQIYCQRGEAENRIKETQLDLFGTRASCHRFDANWFRLMLAGLAYTLMDRFRALALAGTELARASSATIRVKLLKIGAAIVRNTRRIRILLSSSHPMRATFLTAARALAP
jgi:Transposase DDE domain group 1